MGNKERFTDRVENYVKYRPSYPLEALDYLYDTVGIQASSRVADIGAGTGIFSQLLLERGTAVTAIEPNAAMREEAVRSLAAHPRFNTINGAAEETGLPDASVDYIVSAQAFHWFDKEAAKNEFARILVPEGKVVLIWNSRRIHGTPFLEEYEKLLLTYGTDYATVNHRNVLREDLEAFFRPGELHEERFAINQLFDFDGLKGRLRSSSYSPAPGHSLYEPMMNALQALFDRHAVDGVISFEYETEVYWGGV